MYEIGLETHYDQRTMRCFKDRPRDLMALWSVVARRKPAAEQHVGGEDARGQDRSFDHEQTA